MSSGSFPLPASHVHVHDAHPHTRGEAAEAEAVAPHLFAKPDRSEDRPVPVRDPSFHLIDEVGDLAFGDSGEAVLIVAVTAYGWKVHRYSLRDAERVHRALGDAITNAKLTRHANAGYPDIRPAREACA